MSSLDYPNPPFPSQEEVVLLSFFFFLILCPGLFVLLQIIIYYMYSSKFNVAPNSHKLIHQTGTPKTDRRKMDCFLQCLEKMEAEVKDRKRLLYISTEILVKCLEKIGHHTSADLLYSYGTKLG